MTIYDELPGPPGRWWGLPDFNAMRRDYLGAIERLRPYGDLVRQRVLYERSLDMFDPDQARRLLVEHHDKLIRYERGTEVFAQLMGQSVLVTEGATWQRQRRMLHAGFTPRRMAGYAALMTAATQDALWPMPPGETDMDALFTHLTMDVILRTLFSQTAQAGSRDAARAVQVLGEIGLREMFWPMTLPDWLPLPGKAAKRRAQELMRGLVGDHIAARRRATAPPHDDVLAMLLALRDEETGAALSDQEVFDQCMVSFQAGHETSASTLLWWSALMATHPEAQRRVADEVQAVLRGRVPTADDVALLPGLTATLKEAMRLYPPIPALLTRRTTQAFEFDGVRLPRRLLVRITPWALHRDPRSFEQPDAYRPERFLPGAVPPPRGAYIPFGIGPRICLGQHFAMLELTLVAAMLLQQFRLERLDDTPLRTAFNVTLRPAGGLRLRLVKAA